MPRLYSPSVVHFYEELWAADGARHLRDLIAHGYYGVLPPGDSYGDDLPIRFIRSAEMNADLDVDLDDCPFVEEQYYIKKAQVQKDDVLLAVKGATIASRKCVAHVRDDVGRAIVNGSIYRMQAKPENNPRFLAIILSTEMLKRQMRLALTANNGVDYLDKSLIHHLVVPAPDRAVQDRLVATYDAAMSASVSAKQQAAALLASIDDYLLSELGITLPPEIENTLENRTFRVGAHELGGWRFDPPVYQSDFSLQSDAINSVPLGRVCHVNPRTSFSGLHGNDLAGFVPMDAISDRLGIVEYLSDRPVEECVGYTTFRDQDVLWAKITPCMENGKSAVVDGLTNGVGFGSTEFHVIRARGGAIAPEYVHALLRMGRVRREAKRFFTGSSGHRRVDDAFLRKLVIPVPTKDVQARLVEVIRHKREQAIELEIQAAAELDAAKREIEAILLSGAA